MSSGINESNLSKIIDALELNITPKNQKQLYQDNNSPDTIVKLSEMNGKTFGDIMTRISRYEFGLSIPSRIVSNPGCHDHTITVSYDSINTFLIEQKSSRYPVLNNGKMKWRWQHIKRGIEDGRHNWDFLIVCGLDFHTIKHYITTRHHIDRLISRNIVRGQGSSGRPEQGYWFETLEMTIDSIPNVRVFQTNKDVKFENYFISINSNQDIQKYINHQHILEQVRTNHIGLTSL